METNGGDCATARGDLLGSKPKKVAADKTTNDLNATGDKYNADALVLPCLTTKQLCRHMKNFGRSVAFGPPVNRRREGEA